MKSYLLLIAMSAVAVAAYPQKTFKEFFNEDWKKCDSITARYFRVIAYNESEQPVGKVTTFYMNGEKEWEGQYYKFNKANSSESTYQGACTWFYENGRKKKTAFYRNGVLTGTCTGWFENGNRMYIANYLNGLAQGLTIAWYETGLLRNYGVFDKGRIIAQESIHCNKFGDCTFREEFNFRRKKGTFEKTYGYYTMQKMIELKMVNKSSTYSYIDDTQFESYSDPEVFEYKKDSTGVTAKTVNKKGLRMKSGKKAGCRVIFKPLDYSAYFLVSSSITMQPSKKNPKGGLVFAYRDPKNYQFFVINAKGDYEIGEMVDGVRTVFVNGTSGKKKYDYSRKNSSRSFALKVFSAQDSLFFSCDNEELYKKKGIHFSGEYVGYYLGGNHEMTASNMYIRTEANPPFVSADVDKKIIKNKAWRGSGSGLVITTDGYVVTNHHVVNDATEVQVEMVRNGEWVSYNCDVILKDEKSDLAIIKINDSTFKHFDIIPFSIKTQLADVGAQVFTLGYPLARSLGNELKYMEGAVNARTGYQGELLAYQISVALQPGNSGGPLFDTNGNLVGVVNSKLNNASNVGFAIKSNYIVNLLQMLPSNPAMPSNSTLGGKNIVDQVNILRAYVPMIKVR